MSIDNGVYIGVFPKADGSKEFRVAEACSIDNCDDFSNPDGTAIHYRNVLFGDCVPFSTHGEAFEMAHKILDTLDYCEYGIKTIQYDEPLPKCSVFDSQKFLVDFWKKA